MRTIEPVIRDLDLFHILPKLVQGGLRVLEINKKTKVLHLISFFFCGISTIK